MNHTAIASNTSLTAVLPQSPDPSPLIRLLQLLCWELNQESTTDTKLWRHSAHKNPTVATAIRETKMLSQGSPNPARQVWAPSAMIRVASRAKSQTPVTCTRSSETTPIQSASTTITKFWARSASRDSSELLPLLLFRLGKHIVRSPQHDNKNQSLQRSNRKRKKHNVHNHIESQSSLK